MAQSQEASVITMSTFTEFIVPIMMATVVTSFAVYLLGRGMLWKVEEEG